MAFNKGPKREIIFHSALADRGPVRITVDDEPRYLKNKQRDVVEVTIGNEKLLYWCENEQCAEFFKGQKDRTFTVIAEGKKEDATITYVGESGAQPGSTSAPPQRQAANPPPTSTPEPARATAAPSVKTDWVDRFLEGKRHAGQLGVALRLAGGQCLMAAVSFCEANGVKVDDGTKLGLVKNISEAMCQGETIRTLVIAMGKDGMVGCLPQTLNEDVMKRARERVEARKAKKSEPPPEPKPEPVPEPDPEPDRDVIDDVPF